MTNNERLLKQAIVDALIAINELIHGGDVSKKIAREQVEKAMKKLGEME